MSTYPRIDVNGIAMDDGVNWAMDNDQPLRGLPGRRATSVVVPGRSGVIWPREDTRDVGSFSINLKVLGNGSTMDARVASLDVNISALNFLFDQPSITVDYWVSAGRVYRAECRLIAATVPEYGSNLDWATVKYVLEIPDSCWRGLARQEVGFVTTTGYQEIPFLAGSAAPITDSRVFVRGPFTSVTVSAGRTHQSLTLPSVGANQAILLDADKQSAMMLYGSQQVAMFDGIGPDITGQIKPTGPGSATSWLDLVPQADAADPSNRKVFVQVLATGAGSGYAWHIESRAAY